ALKVEKNEDGTGFTRTEYELDVVTGTVNETVVALGLEDADGNAFAIDADNLVDGSFNDTRVNDAGTPLSPVELTGYFTFKEKLNADFNLGAGDLAEQYLAFIAKDGGFENEKAPVDDIQAMVLVEMYLAENPNDLREVEGFDSNALLWEQEFAKEASNEFKLMGDPAAELAQWGFAQEVQELDGFDVAADLARQAIGRYTDAGPLDLSTAPGSLINVLIVSGQTSLALGVASEDSDLHFAQRPGTTEFIPFAGAEPIVERIRVLAAGGVHGPPLHTELDTLESIWRIAGYSGEEQQLLRNGVTLRLHGVAAGLVADSTALSEWARSEGVQLPTVPDHVEQAYHMFYLVLPTAADRTRFIAHLAAADMQAVFHYVPLHVSPFYREWYGEVSLPVTERLSDQLVRLPLYYSVGDDEVDTVIEAVRSFYGAC
ncbi:MAG: DegT/DnrJ/EryC1/StrS family aminotransferase, partial [Armatimonadetes bacterium]|nr:DegT/DnrJ/EryC1/StrS family aminotransferase [Armatimonadota bacterium]